MKISNISVKSWLWLHLVQIKIIMYRNYMHLKMTVRKERREACAQDVVRILWREQQKMGIIEVLSFLDALVIPNVVILGILNSLRPSKIHQYVSKCFGKFEGMKRFVSISTVLATSKKNS